MKARLALLGAALLLAGCSSGVKGTYVGGDDSLLKSLTFKDDGKVDVVLINGIGGEGTFEVDGDTVRVSANGSTTELTIDRDCLRGPLMMGTLCKGGAQGSASTGESTGSRTGGALAGSVFEISSGGGRMAFEFADAQTVRVSTASAGPGGTGSIEGTYTVTGDQVVITIQGQPETFTLSGDTLSGELDGDQLTLHRQ